MTSVIETPRPPVVSDDDGGKPIRHLKVAVIGTGFSGLGVAIKLLESGQNDFLVFERADDIGGTWRDNTYPGCACDVMALLYQYSFAQTPSWSHTFASRTEVLNYLRDCADRYGVRPYVRFQHEMVSAQWDELTRRWRIVTSQGNYTAQVLVAGTGYLSDPAIPQIPGLESFEGALFHSSNWDHDFDLKGKRVAVIGTGASAIQFVPAIQPEVGHMDLYQRTPPWIGPKPDKVITNRQMWLRKYFPGYLSFRRNFNKNGREILAFLFSDPKRAEKSVQGMAAKHLVKSVPDKELRARLTPNYSVACKRLLFSNTWYPALQASNVDVISDGISHVEGKAVVGTDGVRREVDAIILGTGFLATARPVAGRLTGRHGVTLEEAWKDGMSAFRGTTVPGFPNLFLMLGPNTTLGHSSQTLMIEAQMAYVVDAVKQMGERNLASVEVKPDVEAAYNDALQEKVEGTVWSTAGGCKSWYMDANGRNPSIWPTYTFRFRRSTKRFDLESYQIATSVGADRLAARS